MVHRHVYGEEVTRYFVGTVNSDKTEGRGPMVEVAYSEDPLVAKKAVEGQSVQGEDGKVSLVIFNRCEGCPVLLKSSRGVYEGSQYIVNNYGGKSISGSYENLMPDGWYKDWSPMAQDPDYAKYLELKARFEK